MKKKLCVLVSALLCAAALYGCGNTASTPKEKVYVDASEIANVYSAPKDYVGKYIQLTGKVFTEVDKGNSSISFQMFQDPENSERNTVITCSDTSLSVKNGDYIKVDGMIKGTFEGTNAYGGSVNALSISADTVTVASYAEIMAPALKTIELTNAVKDQHQCSVQITKVEIAEKETRVYVTAKNGSDKDMSLYSFNAKLLQGSKQIEEQDNYQADYEEVQSTLLPGMESSGILCFGPVDASADFKVYIEAHNDNYRLDFDPYQFDVSVQQ